jgi:addiction module RelE/StbE family toxin
MKLTWSPQAIDDLRSIRAYIGNENPQAARAVVSAIIGLVESLLARHPYAARPGRNAGTRELVIPKLPYVVPYRVADERIEILRVYHASRRWPDQL